MSDTASSPPAVGRTVRELVETTPQLVTDRWCRQLAAQLLRSVETQQAMGRPHRIIMPDSIVVHADGAAELLSSPEEDSEFQPPTAVDLKAIAAVLHFAITRESPPAGPLAPRAPAGLSDGLLEAIDSCLYGDRTRRPQTIEAMRALLGMPQAVEAAPAPRIAPSPVQATQAPLLAPVEIAPAPPLPPARASRALLAALAVVILAAAGFGLYQHGRQAGAESVLASTAAPAVPDASALPAPTPMPAVTAPEPAPAVVEATQEATAAPVEDTAAATASAPPAAAASATYKLVIKPWGTVYVDGIKRGISPPLKSLTLTGEHTIRIDNPDFHSRTITLRPGKDNTTRIEHAFR